MPKPTDTKPEVPDNADKPDGGGGGEPANSPEGGGAETKTYSQEEVEALLAKVRGDEKDKLYRRLEKVDALAADLETAKVERAKAEEEAKKLADVEAVAKRREEESKLDVDKRFEAFEKRMGEQLAAKDAEIAEVRATSESAVKTAMERVKAAELGRLKTDLIAKHGIKHLSALVTGDSADALEASAKDVAQQEQAIYEEAKAVAAEGSVPTPITPPNDGGDGKPTRAQSIQDRVAAARTRNPADYEKHRVEALQKAREAMRNYGS